MKSKKPARYKPTKRQKAMEARIRRLCDAYLKRIEKRFEELLNRSEHEIDVKTRIEVRGIHEVASIKQRDMIDRHFDEAYNRFLGNRIRVRKMVKILLAEILEAAKYATTQCDGPARAAFMSFHDNIVRRTTQFQEL